MSLNAPSLPSPPSPPSPPPPGKRRKLLYGCGALLFLLVLVVVTVALTVWWIQRPIRPVVLSAQEKAAVDEKLRLVGGDTQVSRNGLRSAPPDSSSKGPPSTNSEVAPSRNYVPGSKVLKITEREINGLLNANTDLGNSVRLEFAKDAINAYLVVPIPKDFPVGGGKMFRARGRFRLSLGNEGTPYAILDDVTVFGLSLPKAWLGGLKGENLLGEATGKRNGTPVLRGIKSVRIEPGALVLEVED
jgi:hypothetical protein